MIHKDIYIPASTAADAVNANGTIVTGVASVVLFDPGNRGWICRHMQVSVAAAMRIVVGVADQDGLRVRAGTLTAGGGFAPDDCFEGSPNQKVYILRDAVGVVDVQAEFDLT